MIILIPIVLVLLLFIITVSEMRSRYYEEKLRDMNNCFGMDCKDCDKEGCGERGLKNFREAKKEMGK